jgi:peroxiredoxin
VQETPSLVQMQQRLKDKGIIVLAVSTDADDDAYHRFIKQHNVNLLTVRDAKQQSNTLYGSVMFPETWIIDRTGMVRRKFVGPVDWNTQEITEFLTRL